MEIRRRIRRTVRYFRRRLNRQILSYCLFVSFGLAQAEYQIITIPQNSLMLSNHNGLSGYVDNNNPKKIYSFNIIKFPSNINYFKLHYKKTSFSILDFGTLEDKINNQVFNRFNAYEANFQYNSNKTIFNKFLLSYTFGGIYSKIENISSIAVAANIKINTRMPQEKIYFALSINNIGKVLKEYTIKQMNLPLNIQLGIAYKLQQTSILLGYDLIYHDNFESYEHIACLQFPIGDVININLSFSNLRKALLIDNYKDDWFYGIGGGITITSKIINTNIGIASLGPAGFIYGISLNRLLE